MLLTSSVMAVEVGVKLGNATVKDKDSGSTNLDAYVALYADLLLPITPIFHVGPMFELGYGSKEKGDKFVYCKTPTYFGYCKLSYVYTTAEANAHGLISVTPMVDIYGGAGVSYNKFGLKGTDASGSSVGYVSDESANGVQAYVGAQVKFRGVGIGIEAKYKKVSSDRIDSVFVGTLNIFGDF